jgi:hypothetical protein
MANDIGNPVYYGGPRHAPQASVEDPELFGDNVAVNGWNQRRPALDADVNGTGAGRRDYPDGHGPRVDRACGAGRPESRAGGHRPGRWYRVAEDSRLTTDHREIPNEAQILGQC